MAGATQPSVALVAVDEAVLADLVDAAIRCADANEVTPLLSGLSGWSPERVAWLQAFHRDRRLGLDGPAQEATWAVLLDRRVVGSVRLKHTGQPGILETGAWLVRDVRGHGVGKAAMVALLHLAGELGATAVTADTSASNGGALGVLRRLGFQIASGGGEEVRATVQLRARPIVHD